MGDMAHHRYYLFSLRGTPIAAREYLAASQPSCWTDLT
jgi:hypothetical protein